MLKIGEFSKLAQVSVKTLRYYDELGLLRPDWIDRYTSYRYYTLQQLPRLNRILALRELGFSLVQIARLLREDLPPVELQRLMKLRQVELEHAVQAEQARLARVTARLRQIEQEGHQPRYEVIVKRIEPRLVASIRDTIADQHDIGSLSAELRSYLKHCGTTPGTLPPYLAIYHDTEYLDRGADVEVAIPLEDRQRGNARVTVYELPAITDAASVIHTGSYDRISGAYRALVAWTQANGYRTAGPNREIYLQGLAEGLDPSHYVTELQFPIQQVSLLTIITQQEGHIMQPQIVTKPAFTVVGLPFTGFITSAPYEDGKENNEIGVVWGEFNRRAPEIQNICGPTYGLCFGMPNEREPWYIAGVEVSRAEEIPAGMMSMSVPAQKYAVFPCTLGTLGATYRHITEEWQSQTGYEHAEAPDFELYDAEFDPNTPQNGKLAVYWPIN